MIMQRTSRSDNQKAPPAASLRGILHNMKWPFLILVFVVGVVSVVHRSIAADSDANSGSKSGTLQTCLACASDLSAIYPTDTFPTDVTSVSAVFHLGDDENYDSLTSIWIAEDVGSVAPANTEIGRADVAIGVRRAGHFEYSQTGPMPPGKYRLEVTAEGKPWKTVHFTILSHAQQKTVELKSVNDLLCADPGRVHTYDLVQEGVNVSIPGVEPDDKGRVHATVVQTVIGVDQFGTQIQVKRNDALVQDEWWRMTDNGAFLMRVRNPAGKVITFDQAKEMLPFPITTQNKWEIPSADKLLPSQTMYLWGPVPIKWAGGESLGYVVAALQTLDTLNIASVERQYVPSVGMVDEKIITSFNDETLRTQEMSLRATNGGADASTPSQ
jgi:hypothetical protein